MESKHNAEEAASPLTQSTAATDTTLEVEKGHVTKSQEEEVAQGRWITPKQMADALGYTRAWVSELCSQGRIKAIKPTGGQWRIPMSELERIKREGTPPVRRRHYAPPSTRISVEPERASRIAPEPQQRESDQPKRRPRVSLWPLPIELDSEED